MTTPAQPLAAGATPLRIVEIAGRELFFGLAAPGQTEAYWAGNKPRNRAKLALGPFKLIRMIKRLRRGEFDLLAVHTAQYAPWHPRSLLTILRDWHIRAPL